MMTMVVIRNVLRVYCMSCTQYYLPWKLLNLNVSIHWSSLRADFLVGSVWMGLDPILSDSLPCSHSFLLAYQFSLHLNLFYELVTISYKPWSLLLLSHEKNAWHLNIYSYYMIFTQTTYRILNQTTYRIIYSLHCLCFKILLRNYFL